MIYKLHQKSHSLDSNILESQQKYELLSKNATLYKNEMKNLKINTIETALEQKDKVVDELLQQEKVLQDLLDSLEDNQNVSIIQMVTNSQIYKELEQEMLELKKEMFVLRQNGSSKSNS